jgi:hypothetical protein
MKITFVGAMAVTAVVISVVLLVYVLKHEQRRKDEAEPSV